jgi:hypothetical protein
MAGYLFGVCAWFTARVNIMSGPYALTSFSVIIFGGCNCSTRINTALFFLLFLLFIRLGIALVYHGFAICRRDPLCVCVGVGYVHANYVEAGCMLMVFCIPLMLHFELIKNPFSKRKKVYSRDGQPLEAGDG